MINDQWKKDSEVSEFQYIGLISQKYVSSTVEKVQKQFTTLLSSKVVQVWNIRIYNATAKV